MVCSEFIALHAHRVAACPTGTVALSLKCKMAINGNYKAMNGGKAKCQDCVTGADSVFANFEEFLGDDLNKPVVAQVRSEMTRECQ